MYTFICRHCKKIEQIEGRGPHARLLALGWRFVDRLRTGSFPNGQTSAECPGCQGKPS